VEQSDVPGEKTSPTQPFPTKPPPYDRQGFSLNDVIDFTPELKAKALEIISHYKIGPIFTPPVLSKVPGPLGTLAFATASGGTVWAGGSLDPETGIAYLYSRTSVVNLGMVPSDPKVNDFRFIQGTATEGARASGGAGGDAAAIPGGGEGPANALSVQGLPLYKPPYGRITAMDMNKGEILWQVAHGETPDAIRNNPALKGVTIPRTGRAGIIGTIVTKTLVIAGEAGNITMPDGKRGAYLRAYDKKTGADAGMVPMPAGQTGSPMTYMLDGKQYIVLAIGAAGYPAEYVAYRLPN
jgi:quinoprotein glucose dehydrogenase